MESGHHGGAHEQLIVLGGVHHTLGHIDAIPCDVEVSIDVLDGIDLATVHTQSQGEIRADTDLARKINRAQDGVFQVGKETHDHSIPCREDDQLFQGVGGLELKRAFHQEA